MKRTQHTLAVASELLALGKRKTWGYELMQLTGLASGTLYPILARFADAGWIEEVQISRDGTQDFRRYYRVTGKGRKDLANLIKTD